MKTELDILKEVCQKLKILNVDYMLTGSLAMSHYSIPRMTRDIDIVLEINLSDAAKFISLFKDEYYISEESIMESIKHEFIFNIIHLESSIKIDFIIRKNEIYRTIEFNRRKKVQLSEFEVYIVSKEDLIISKLIWFKDSESELQKRDIVNLISTKYDKNYLYEWIEKLNLKDVFNLVIK